ncbi:MAG: MATE family efflux transporter [Simkania negevensis]|nr:MATE family efflux transporter [Simkania negevensis]
MKVKKIQNGSIKELWKVSFSLMISFLSMTAMIFCDRLYLAYYSSAALGAVSSAGTLYISAALGWVTLAAMGEVFVAQYNGAKQYEKLGEPIWQMLYLSGFSFIFFLCLSTFGSDFFAFKEIMNPLETTYFRWNCIFAPFWVIYTAFNAFFIGQGKTALVKWLGFLGNGVNIILDPILIFGIKGWIPSYGMKGAAIATGMGILSQLAVVSYLFFKKKNRLVFGTTKWHFQPSLFRKCFKVGSPIAVFVMLDILGWALFYMMMRRVSSQHILIASIGQSILILFIFFGLGLEKGAIAVAGNLIGAKKPEEVKTVLKSGLFLCLIFGIVLTLLFTLFSGSLVDLFFKNPGAFDSSNIALSPTMLIEIKAIISKALMLIAICLVLESIRWLIRGLLVSAGDTFFLMSIGSLSIWFFLLLPTYLLIVLPKGEIMIAFYIWVFYDFIATLVVFLRFLQGKWKKRHLIEEQTLTFSHEQE